MESFMDNVAKEMEHLHKLAVANPEKRFQKLWENLISEKWLSQAWEEIRHNKGSQTPGTDTLTAEDVDLPRIHRLCERLRNGTYRPKAVRRTYIPKSNGKLRPLGIPSLEDRIVQQGLRMVLEPIFEADFLPCSHGFRQGHSPHTALRDVARMYPRVSWVIEGDIVGCYDNIPHTGLLKAVARRIADEKVWRLVSAFLKAGYMENWQYHHTYSGTPQGGISTLPTKWQTWC
jgi:RNA-directed DNA polymerase